MDALNTIDELFYRNLGLELKKIRHEKKIPLSFVASETGYTKQKIDRWELGISRISKIQFSKLCSALNVPEMIDVQIRLGL